MKMTHRPFLELEEGFCVLCHSRQGPVIFEGYDTEFKTCGNLFRFIACRRCTHFFLQNQPKLEDYPIIYQNYLTNNVQSAYYPSPLTGFVKTQIFDRIRTRELFFGLNPGSNILEIGAGSGRLLIGLRDFAGFPINLFGNEPELSNEQKNEWNQVGIQYVPGMIEHWKTDLKFDLVLGIHVIEHVYDPNKTLNWIQEHLTVGGKLYLETPDAEALAARIFKSNWGMTHFPRHFNLFSKKSLSALIRKNKLSVYRQLNLTSAPAWNMSFRNWLGMDAVSKKASLLEIFNYSNVLTLLFFTLLDFLLLLLRIPTSAQAIIAEKRVAG